jgi:nitrite reductase (NADH) large subunit
MTKQTTGYILMGLTFVALGLSLRKRWSRFSFGAFRSWRTVHVLLGLGTLVGLVAHTGLRFGSNLKHLCGAQSRRRLRRVGGCG